MTPDVDLNNTGDGKKCVENEELQIKGSFRRWIIITIFIIYAGTNSFAWIEYSIISNIIVKYYKVSTVAVNWTSTIFLALYPLLVIPASYVIEKKGCRTAALIGCIGTLLGGAVKIFSIGPDLFYVVMIGQAITSASQSVILCLPPKVAAVWFKSNEVSTACSLGVFGTQLGTAIGYVLPPLIVRDHKDLEQVGTELQYMCWGLTIVMIPTTIAAIFYFPNQPKRPPSATQLKERQCNKEFSMKNFFLSMLELVKMKPFLAHSVAYGIQLAVFSAIGAVLNEIIVPKFKDAEVAGNMGLVMAIVGMISSIAFGILLDKTRKYKEITLFIYFMTAVSLVLFMYAIEMKSKVFCYIAFSIYGLFSNGYFPAGFEMAIELTYPYEEGTTSGVIIAVSQVLGVVCTMIFAELNTSIGSFWALASQVVVLLIGTIVSALIPNILKRQEAFKEEALGRFTAVPTNEKE